MQKITVLNANGVWSTHNAWSTNFDFNGQPNGTRYLWYLNLQGLDGYTAWGTIFKSPAGHMRIETIQADGVYAQIASNRYFQGKQQSGANQTGSSGYCRLYRLTSMRHD